MAIINFNLAQNSAPIADALLYMRVYSTMSSPILYTSPAPTVSMTSPGLAVARRLFSISPKLSKKRLPGIWRAKSAEEIWSVLVSLAAYISGEVGYVGAAQLLYEVIE